MLLTAAALLASGHLGCAHSEQRQTWKQGPADSAFVESAPAKQIESPPDRAAVRTVQYEASDAVAEAESEPSGPTPARVPGQPLSLSDLREMAAQMNPTLAQASAEIESGRGVLLQAGLYPNPQVGYLNNSADPSRAQQSNGAFLSQEFVTANKLGLAKTWQAYDVERISWEAEAQRQRVLNDIAIRFYEVLGAQEAVAVATELESIAAEGLAGAKALMESGEGSKNDVLQAEIQLETVRMSKQDAIFRQEAAWGQLASMIGDPHLPLSAVVGTLDGDVPELDFDQRWQVLLANSPQILAAQALIDHSRAEYNLNRAQVVPNVTVQTVIQRDNALQATEASTLVSLPVPIFNRNQGNIRRAEAEIQVAATELDRTRLVLHDLLADSFRRYRTSRLQVVRFRAKVLPNAEQSLKIVSDGYKTGERSFLEVLTARQTYFQTRLAYVEALAEVHKVLVEIEGLELTGGLNPANIGTAIQAQPGGANQRQRALINQVEQEATRQLLPAAQLGR